MVVDIISALGAGFVALYCTSTVVRMLGGDSFATLVLQLVMTIGIGVGLFSIHMISAPVAVTVALMPVVLRIVALLWFYYIGKKILNGDYGEESRWAAELVEAEDDAFIKASNKLSEMELRESGIIATDKSEMRDIVVEKAEETDES